MVSTLPIQGANGTVRRVRISLPLIEILVDGVRYFLPDDLPAPAGEEKRALYQPRIGEAKKPRRRRRSYTRQQIGAFYRVLSEP